MAFHFPSWGRPSTRALTLGLKVQVTRSVFELLQRCALDLISGFPREKTLNPDQHPHPQASLPLLTDLSAKLVVVVRDNPYISREAAGQVGSTLHGGIAESLASGLGLPGLGFFLGGFEFRLEGVCSMLLAHHKVFGTF